MAAVFIPVLFMGGMVGRLLYEFAVTIGTAVLISGVVFLTLTPMACSHFLRPPGESHVLLYAFSERIFDGMIRLYDRNLRRVLQHPRITMVVLLLTLVLTGYLFWVIPKGFIPNSDSGRIFGFTEASQDISFEAMKQYQQAVADIIRQDPYLVGLIVIKEQIAAASRSLKYFGGSFYVLVSQDNLSHCNQQLYGIIFNSWYRLPPSLPSSLHLNQVKPF